MKKFVLAIIFIFLTNIVLSQSVFGKWKTIDDETGLEKGIVEIYEKNGKIHGRILEIFEEKYRNKKCNLCPSEDAMKPLLGLTIIKGLQKDGTEYNGGKIMDPKNGKSYKCYITLESNNKLKVRGYLGIALFGRTQYWYRVQ
jgi:uncharacterized protein (DUF2147 family)